MTITAFEQKENSKRERETCGQKNSDSSSNCRELHAIRTTNNLLFYSTRIYRERNYFPWCFICINLAVWRYVAFRHFYLSWHTYGRAWRMETNVQWRCNVNIRFYTTMKSISFYSFNTLMTKNYSNQCIAKLIHRERRESQRGVWESEDRSKQTENI